MKLENKSRSSHLLTVMAVFMAMTVAYPLLMPPIELLYVHGYLPGETDAWLNTVYAPIDWMCDNYAWFRKSFDWYWELWSPLMPYYELTKSQFSGPLTNFGI